MSLAKFSLLFVLPLAALAGCCCPELSGRYCEIGQAPPLLQHAAGPALACGNADAAMGCGPVGCGPLSGHPPLLAWLHGGHGLGGAGLSGPVPSEQHDDYLSPLPKFHPVPTRPVFEPQPAYQPAMLLDHSHNHWSRVEAGVFQAAK